MALDVKYLRGTRAQYEAYEAANKLVDYYYYLITNTDGSIDLYLGKVKLSNNADLVAAVASIGQRIDDVIDSIDSLDDRVEALETDVAYLKENAGHKFYEVTALPAFAEGHTYKEGDVCIVTITKDGIDYKTAYHCIKDEKDAFVWAAMAGNYNAANVYYDKNIQVTKTVGNVETSNNIPVDLQFKGKNMEQIWQYLYATEDKDVTMTNPNATLDVSSNVNLEAGSTFNDPKVTLSFTGGSYEYGSKDSAGTTYTKNQGAGVLWSEAKVYYDAETDVLLHEKTDSSNTTINVYYDISANQAATSASSNIVADGTVEYKFVATAKCPASERGAITNLGNFVDANKNTDGVTYSTAKKTAARNLTTSNLAKTFTVTGYRNWFYGYKTLATKLADPTAITSDQVRALTAQNGGFPASITTTDMQQMYFLIPKSANKTAVVVANSKTTAKQQVEHHTAYINVEGANHYDSVEYDLFYVNNGNPESGTNTFTITVS
jgi:hypothetical protein